MPQATMKNITVYAGSVAGVDPEFVGTAKGLGHCMLHNGIGLVYGSGTSGMMGAVAETIHNGGGNVLGVIPQFFIDRGIESRCGQAIYGERLVVHDMHERKRIMVERADAFIALPGGIGTLEELVEVMTWHKLSLHNKPIGILNINGCFDGFLKWVDDAEQNGFVPSSCRDSFVVSDDPAQLVKKLIEIKDSRVDISVDIKDIV